jgi:amino acid transporter
MILMGAIAMIASLFLNLDNAAELTNFGACAGFMAVNLSVISHYFFRKRNRNGKAVVTSLVFPALGFGVCLWIWLSVSVLAMKVGAIWSVAGILYLAILIRRSGVDLQKGVER